MINNRMRNTYCHIKALMMIRVTHVSDIKKPDVSHIKHFISFLSEECFKVFSWFYQITKPKHSWKIISSTLKESTFEIDFACVSSSLSL